MTSWLMQPVEDDRLELDRGRLPVTDRLGCRPLGQTGDSGEGNVQPVHGQHGLVVTEVSMLLAEVIDLTLPVLEKLQSGGGISLANLDCLDLLGRLGRLELGLHGQNSRG
jgi:hypothetical protein